MFGYNSIEEYYDQASNAGRLDQITIPLVSVTAANDPFVPSESKQLNWLHLWMCVI